MKICNWRVGRCTVGQLAMLGIATAMLGTAGCGSSAEAQETLVVGESLQSLSGLVLLGPDDSECRIAPAPGGGIALWDPNGVSIFNPQATPNGNLFHALRFGPDNPDAQSECRIAALPGSGMFFQDPEGFAFSNNVQVQGDVLADSFTQSSSRRLKTHVRPIADALHRIARLRGVYFDWTQEMGGGADLGFVAEEVAEVLPQVVTHDEAGRAKGVKYANLVALTIEGIKAQQRALDRLSAENKKLHARIDAMEARFEQLLARMASSR